MHGIGIDIVEIERFERILSRNKIFLHSCFGDEEFLQISEKKFSCASIAARFCVKEAFIKSIGIGIRTIKEFKFIQIMQEKSGRPRLVLKDKFEKLLSELEFSLSLTHSKTCACAVVICFPKFRTCL
ncbi:MAG: holo-ACP synthase [Oscillospiraceae bacterium]|jgi:holo-[acyl-carrier protein] synthase|nr:holo-ACP synthase [Oscillospiraceae bacterium]